MRAPNTRVGVVFWCLVVAFQLQALRAESLPELVSRVRPAVVTITAFDDKGQAFQEGTGFLINEFGHLITNRHVLFGAHRAALKTSDGTAAELVLILGEDKEGDLIKAS